MRTQGYEGWYMKHQLKGEMLALIPGRGRDEAFIQVIGNEGSHYVPYPLQSYRHAGVLRVGHSLFSRHGARVNIQTPQLQLVGRLAYSNLSPLRYDIMGPFAPLPLQTRHTVFSMRHRVHGHLALNGRKLDLAGALGYMEGDRGTSFPSEYIWLQCLGLSQESSIMAAVATVPVGPIHFTGCLAVVLHAGREYRLATYLGVHIQQNSPHCVELCQRGLYLRITPARGDAHPLQAPVQGSMHRPIHEAPSLPVHIHFCANGKVLLDETNPACSFEYVKAPEEP